MASNPNLEIRLGRAKSWMVLASKEGASEHARFVFSWITFNCMYGLPPIDPDNLDKEPESQMKEIRQFLARAKETFRVDREKRTNILDEAIRNCVSEAKALIENPFLSYEYWEGDTSPVNIKEACENDWQHAKEEMDKKRGYNSLLNLTFYRLTVLRNQIIHGSATASPQSKGYEESLKPGVRFLQVMVPALLLLIETYGDRVTDWPKAPYPRRGHRDHPHL